MSLDQARADWRERHRQRRVSLRVQHPRIYWFAVAFGGLYLALIVGPWVASLASNLISRLTD